ncbi:MAG: hypothetical protein SAJ37_05110 [Oscillatoria sp. PMC 1068.18]|nr:hypothetical protein [Oscillatoria sp. PMC 1076.18]MEC4988109.1 hypothetical protein [Oscillatoria sp. PMC 1068.18]
MVKLTLPLSVPQGQRSDRANSLNLCNKLTRFSQNLLFLPELRTKQFLVVREW